MPLRPIETTTREQTEVRHRVSLGITALSLGVVSLSLAIVLFSVPAGLAPKLFLAAPSTTVSALSSATAVTLTWTAPGDDGAAGLASSYDIRYSRTPITASNFSQASAVATPPTPQPAGSTESYTVTGLTPATVYYFAVKTSDEAGNASTISNVATQTTAALALACVPQYTCTDWTACQNSQQVRTCTVTNGCPAGLDQPIGVQACTAPASTTTSPPASGGETVHIIQHIIVAGAAPKSSPLIRVINPTTKKVTKEFLAFDKKNKNGVNVAVGDIDGDHQADIIVGSGAGSDPLVKVFSERGILKVQFNPYGATKKSGVSVASADVNGDGLDEIITVPARSSSQVRVFSYQATTKTFKSLAQAFAFSRSNLDGFTVAAGDLNLDGLADIAVAPQKNSNLVVVLSLSGQTLKKVSAFRPYPIVFKSGLRLAIGDVNGDGRGDIITTGGTGYYAHVRVLTMTGKELANFLPASTAYYGGVDLTAFDVNQDGRDEVITGTYQSGDPGIRFFRYSGLTKKFLRIDSYFVWPMVMRNGMRLASG